MYQAESARALLDRENAGAAVRGGRVGRTVVLLGITSFFTDVSSEMVAAILPLYLVYSVGLSPLQFGVVDGLNNGAAALVRLVGGSLGDRYRRHKEVAAVGYGLSAITRPAFLLVGSVFSAIGAIVMLDRIGKGIRTAPRDALISLSVPQERLGTAFGVHRAHGHRRRDARPAGRVRDPARRARVLRRRVRRQLRRGADRGRGDRAPRQARPAPSRPGPAPDDGRRQAAVPPATLSRARHRRHLPRARDGQRRVRLPAAPAHARLRPAVLPAAVRRLGRRVHAAGGARRAPGRPRRPRQGLRRRLRPAARDLRAAALPARRGGPDARARA